jgi:hypothetical protein
MVFRGVVKRGKIVLERECVLPDGTPVKVIPSRNPRRRQPHGKGDLENLWQGLLAMAGTVEGLPPDMADNHDHYIHGTRRKKA